MDPTRFDLLTRSLTRVARSRRGILRLAGAALIGAGSGDAATEAAPRQTRKKCNSPSRAMCGTKCVNLLKNNKNCGACGFDCRTEIPTNPICVHGACCTNRHGTDCSCVLPAFACDAKTCCQFGPCQNGLCPP
ncbi:MAG TPA: hypothetical protein VFU81_21270 [Thermomicrobiales bacterium]|nr:hypothetical protein [Thermomicrobiales bacterium]